MVLHYGADKTSMNRSALLLALRRRKGSVDYQMIYLVDLYSIPNSVGCCKDKDLSGSSSGTIHEPMHATAAAALLARHFIVAPVSAGKAADGVAAVLQEPHLRRRVRGRQIHAAEHLE